ncbi:MAG: hypothetical protein WCZ48_02610 [Bacillota bacterium]
MKKNLTIVIAALIVAAMAIPASAAELKLSGAYSAGWTYDTRVWTPTNLAEASKLTLKLEFTEGESIVAYLPLTVKPFVGEPEVAVGSWYFSYATAPFSFWVSPNDPWNAKQFSALGDPLGIGAKLGGGVVLNAKGNILGAGLNIYAAGLATGAEAYLGRATYGLPAEFTLGLIGAYTVTDPETDPDELILGADVVGPIPGIGGKITVAGATFLTKDFDTAWEFEGVDTNDNYAYRLALTDIAVGPVKNAWAKYTAVGGNFVSNYAIYKDGKILNDYKGAAAAEVGVTVGIPVGIPVDLTLGNTLWMGYPTEPEWNETTAKVEVEPLKDLKATVSGAYKVDLDDTDDAEEGKDYAGYKVHGDVSYDAFGLNFKPYVDYLAKSYAKSDDKDTVIGIDIKGNPISDDNEIGVNASYTVEEPITDLFGYGIYTTDLNPGFVQSAKSQVAAVASYTINGEDDPETDFYGYAGTALTITDALGAKLGVLSKDSEDGIVASAKLDYKVSESISTGLTYTFRQVGADGWEHYKDEGRNYVKANVKGTVGDSTITLAYGVDGLKDADKTGFHVGKPWAYLRNHPGEGMNWQLLTLSVNVPF